MKGDVLQFGIIGLGRMGGNLAKDALGKQIRVVGYARKGAPRELVDAGLVEIKSIAEFNRNLAPPRAVFLYIPAGKAVDKVIEELAPHLDPGDIIVDGGNSYWGDSIRRHGKLQDRHIEFVDLGTSGGISGARQGACFMAGGSAEAYAQIEPILKRLAVEGGCVHAGGSGAGHFVKLVHNGIEFGMLQAIGEGIALLEKYHRSREPIEIAETIRCWRHGSVIRGWLMELMHECYEQRGGVMETPSYVEDTGEVNWLVDDAMHLEVPVPVIAQSIMQLIASRDETKVATRAIAEMRHGFGGHPFGPDDSVAKERREGRIGGFVKSTNE